MWHSLLTFLDKHNGLLTALFTLALVIVTGLLCWLTRKTLLIQKLQIDSTQKSSCAFVYLEGFDKNVLYPPRCDLRLVSNVNAERDVIYIESVLNKLNCIFIDMIFGRQITESLSWEDLPSFPKTPELIVASKHKYISPLLIIL